MRDVNRGLLIEAARLLKPLLDELVFTGGCTTGLMITDEAAPDVRHTIDVDAIVEITSYREYAAFSERVKELGLQPDGREGAPLCRWTNGSLTLDLMPLEGRVLGFSNRWYRPAAQAAERIALDPGLEVRAVTAPYFTATKLEAFKGRGRDDYAVSHDLEDVISVVDGREALAQELRAAGAEVRMYVAREVRKLLAEPRFMDALPGFLPPDRASQARIGLLLPRLEQIAAL